MKKLAACDYEDLLQVGVGLFSVTHGIDVIYKCSIPVFEGLLPSPHNRIILNLLYELATWLSLAKLRLHTETTLKALEASTKRLGDVLREFRKVTCEAYVTKELPSEEAARGRREAALHSKQQASNGPTQGSGTTTTQSPNGSTTSRTSGKGKREKKFNLLTYKFHALGDYSQASRMFGTTDSYTTQVVSFLPPIGINIFTSLFREKLNIKK